MMPVGVLFSILAPLTLFSFGFALLTGSVELAPSQIMEVLLGNSSDPVAQTIVWQLRLPRASAAFVVGGLLSLAGVLMQALLRNPLADPYILGVSGGAAFAALNAMLLGISGPLLSLWAWLGAGLSMLIVFSLSYSRQNWSATQLLLTGVVIAAGWGAMISFVLATAPAQQLKGMLFWLMGDLSDAQTPTLGFTILLLGLVSSFLLARTLNLLLLGGTQASALGLSIKSVRISLYILGSLLTATAVTIAGSVGFIGLIVPHFIRLLIGTDHRWLIPASVLTGGSLLVISDTLARTIIAPQQLPVGILTALLGVPVFIFLLQRSTNRMYG